MPKTKRILIADDDPDDLMLFEETVKDIDRAIDCIKYNSCELLLKHLREDKIGEIPDFIFLDINMPRLNGIDCLKELKKIDGIKDIPVVMYSTTSNPKDIQYTLELGAIYFLKKPSNLDKLFEELTAILRVYHT